ncbi:MAG: alpha/beta fold hydrolase [Vicinamibacterales bacterium]
MARRILLTIAVVAALVYGAAIAYLFLQETRLVFAAGRPLATGRPAQPFEQLEIPRADRLRQFGFSMRLSAGSDRMPWVLFLHGNSATVASRVNIVRYEQLRALGLNVLAPEYRGFGGLADTPSERTVSRDARHGYDYLRNGMGIPPERIVVYGWSLGSAIAVNMTSEVPAAAVILEGAPASLVAIGQRQYPWMPVRSVMRNPFESISKVKRITAPMLFIHSPEDAVIPIEEGRKLFDAANDPKEFVEVRGGHIDPADVDSARMFGAIRDFLHRHGLLRTATSDNRSRSSLPRSAACDVRCDRRSAESTGARPAS